MSVCPFVCPSSVDITLERSSNKSAELIDLKIENNSPSALELISFDAEYSSR